MSALHNAVCCMACCMLLCLLCILCAAWHAVCCSAVHCAALSAPGRLAPLRDAVADWPLLLLWLSCRAGRWADEAMPGWPLHRRGQLQVAVCRRSRFYIRSRPKCCLTAGQRLLRCEAILGCQTCDLLEECPPIPISLMASVPGASQSLLNGWGRHVLSSLPRASHGSSGTPWTVYCAACLGTAAGTGLCRRRCAALCASAGTAQPAFPTARGPLPPTAAGAWPGRPSEPQALAGQAGAGSQPRAQAAEAACERRADCPSTGLGGRLPGLSGKETCTGCIECCIECCTVCCTVCNLLLLHCNYAALCAMCCCCTVCCIGCCTVCCTVCNLLLLLLTACCGGL